jgi:hypothetical protein
MMKIKPVKAMIDTCITIFGPYLSAAHPLNYHQSRHLHAAMLTYEQTNDTTGGASITQGGLPVGRDGITYFGGVGRHAKSFQEVG